MYSVFARTSPTPSGRWALGLVLFIVLACELAAAEPQAPLRLPPTDRASQSAAASHRTADSPGSHLPRVPLREPRPAEGEVPELQWETDVPPNTPPTAGFIDPVRGNDAVIEVVIGQARLLTLRSDLVNERGTGVIAVADPSVVDFDVMPNPRLIRLLARRAGVTDLSITTAEGEIYNFEVHVVYDLKLLDAQLRHLFPEAGLRLFQFREHLAVEGQVRSTRQMDQILGMLEMYLASLPASAGGQPGGSAGGTQSGRDQTDRTADELDADSTPPNGLEEDPQQQGGVSERGAWRAAPETRGRAAAGGAAAGSPQILNLLRVPGVHQVMLQVRMAEVNRTGLREIGGDLLMVNASTGNILGTQIGGGVVSAGAFLGAGGLTGSASGATAAGNTAFGIFPSGDFELLLRALRRNSLLSVLAEPNLVAMSGQQASFLAGGEIAVPVPQPSGGGTAVTIEWRDFGVQLDFLPIVLDEETVRLSVTPEVSSLDATLGTTVLGTLVPGLNTRRASTTVEMRQGQTLAIAGLLQVELTAQTDRIPGLGDLPYVGPLFRSTTHRRVEKELLVLVTPHLVAPLEANQLPCLPTDGVLEPNDLEFYLMSRIEGSPGGPSRNIQDWDDPWQSRRLMRLEQRNLHGPVGLTPLD